jgi:hypothetical protein
MDEEETWIRYYDEQYQSHYFVSNLTGTTQWEDPQSDKIEDRSHNNEIYSTVDKQADDYSTSDQRLDDVDDAITFTYYSKKSDNSTSTQSFRSSFHDDDNEINSDNDLITHSYYSHNKLGSRSNSTTGDAISPDRHVISEYKADTLSDKSDQWQQHPNRTTKSFHLSQKVHFDDHTEAGDDQTDFALIHDPLQYSGDLSTHGNPDHAYFDYDYDDQVDDWQDDTDRGEEQEEHWSEGDYHHNQYNGEEGQYAYHEQYGEEQQHEEESTDTFQQQEDIYTTPLKSKRRDLLSLDLSGVTPTASFNSEQRRTQSTHPRPAELPVVAPGGKNQDYLGLARVYKLERPYADPFTKSLCLLCRNEYACDVFFPCQHRCVCRTCIRTEQICDDRALATNRDAYVNCSLCAQVIKLILPNEGGDEVEKYWKWVYEEPVELPAAFMRDFKHSAAIIEKVYVRDSFKKKKRASRKGAGATNGEEGSSACKMS